MTDLRSSVLLKMKLKSSVWENSHFITKVSQVDLSDQYVTKYTGKNWDQRGSLLEQTVDQEPSKKQFG